jgi:hypothetical protein
MRRDSAGDDLSLTCEAARGAHENAREHEEDDDEPPKHDALMSLEQLAYPPIRAHSTVIFPRVVAKASTDRDQSASVRMISGAASVAR